MRLGRFEVIVMKTKIKRTFNFEISEEEANHLYRLLTHNVKDYSKDDRIFHDELVKILENN